MKRIANINEVSKPNVRTASDLAAATAAMRNTMVIATRDNKYYQFNSIEAAEKVGADVVMVATAGEILVNNA